MNNKYVLAIDQGSTSTRVVLVNESGDIVYKENMEISSEYTTGGGVFQNPEEIYQSVVILIDRIIKRNSINPKDILSIGITNQRESTILWDKTTGKYLYKSISWQSKSTDYICNDWIKKGYNKIVQNKTGLQINSYFSASKIVHILNELKDIDIKNVMFGTIDSYLLYKLTLGKVHKTDITNASRTLLYNIHTLEWDHELLNLFNINRCILPQVCPNDSLFGYYNYNNVNIPITALIGDQQSSLLGHQCFNKGDIKCTYGTGCFLLINTGDTIVDTNGNLLSTIGYQLGNKVNYALEGSIFVGGSSLKWLRDELRIINDVKDTSNICLDSNDEDLIVVPSFVGLGSPYWDSEARGVILGIKHSTSRADIIKATLKGIAFQVKDVLNVFNAHAPAKLKFNKMYVDGGASNNNYLMHFQSDILDIELIKTYESETTVLGAAYISGLSSKLFNSIDDILKNKKIESIYLPKMSANERNRQYNNWLLAIKATSLYKPIK
jgi:glycerol kinase